MSTTEKGSRPKNSPLPQNTEFLIHAFIKKYKVVKYKLHAFLNSHPGEYLNQDDSITFYRLRYHQRKAEQDIKKAGAYYDAYEKYLSQAHVDYSKFINWSQTEEGAAAIETQCTESRRQGAAEKEGTKKAKKAKELKKLEEEAALTRETMSAQQMANLSLEEFPDKAPPATAFGESGDEKPPAAPPNPTMLPAAVSRLDHPQAKAKKPRKDKKESRAATSGAREATPLSESESFEPENQRPTVGGKGLMRPSVGGKKYTQSPYADKRLPKTQPSRPRFGGDGSDTEPWPYAGKCLPGRGPGGKSLAKIMQYNADCRRAETGQSGEDTYSEDGRDQWNSRHRKRYAAATSASSDNGGATSLPVVVKRKIKHQKKKRRAVIPDNSPRSGTD